MNSVHLSQMPGLEIPPNNCGKTLEELASFGDRSQWEKPCEASSCLPWPHPNVFNF